MPRRLIVYIHPEAPHTMAETGFSHGLTAYKFVGHFFGLSYRKISGHNQVKNSFFLLSNISVPCHSGCVYFGIRGLPVTTGSRRQVFKAGIKEGSGSVVVVE